MDQRESALGEADSGERPIVPGDPGTQTRIAQYEMAFRMQTSVPDLANVADEPQFTLQRVRVPSASLPNEP